MSTIKHVNFLVVKWGQRSSWRSTYFNGSLLLMAESMQR